MPRFGNGFHGVPAAAHHDVEDLKTLHQVDSCLPADGREASTFVQDSGLKVVVVELAQRRSLAVALFEITPQTPIHGTADIVDFPD